MEMPLSQQPCLYRNNKKNQSLRKIVSMKRNRLLSIIVSCTLCFSAYAQANNTDAKINQLLKQMTLDDKIGQMTQVTLAVVAKGGWGNTDGELDPALLKTAIQKYHVGSMLNTTAHALEVDTWRKM